MNIWIKFIKDYDSHTASEVVSMSATEANVLIKAGIAEKTDEPAEVAAKATELTGELEKFVETAVNSAVEGVIGQFEKRFAKATTDLKGKRGAAARITTHDNAEDDPTHGFKSIGEQVSMIRKMSDPAQRSELINTDERCKRMYAAVTSKAPTTYANEGLGADGGFLLAPTFGNQVLAHTFDDEALLARTDMYTTGSNNLTIPKDETTPWGTSGVQVYWAAEAAQLTQSKLKLGQINLTLHKLTALVPVTDEQLADSFVGIGQYVTRQAGERIRWACDEALVNGTGVGKPLGFFNSGALVSQAKESGQTAATIVTANVAKMISRIPNMSIGRCCWMVHPAAFPQLVLLSNANNSLYLAPGQIAGASPNMGTLLGIPIVVSEHCPATVGTQGDIFLVDWSRYITLTKGDGIQTAMSIHLFFDYDVSAFRFIFRVAGQPWLSTYITSAYGAHTMSPFVTLDTRS